MQEHKGEDGEGEGAEFKMETIFFVITKAFFHRDAKLPFFSLMVIQENGLLCYSADLSKNRKNRLLSGKTFSD